VRPVSEPQAQSQSTSIERILAEIEKLKKAVGEVKDVLSSSSLEHLLERLNATVENVKHYVNREIDEFSVKIYYRDDEKMSVAVHRPFFSHLIERLPLNTQLLEIYRMFFNDNKLLNELVATLVYYAVSVASEVKKNIDIFNRVERVEDEVRRLEREIEELRKKESGEESGE
jgi:regulator of replication initiation timing